MSDSRDPILPRGADEPAGREPMLAANAHGLIRRPTIPRLLEALVAAGRWPRDIYEANAQHVRLRASSERVNALAPEEWGLYLYPPPFLTIREMVDGGESFWTEPPVAQEGINFERAIPIGDFGIGTDAPIVLDYRDDMINPRVIRLRYRNHEPTQWVPMAPDFETLVNALGL